MPQGNSLAWPSGLSWQSGLPALHLAGDLVIAIACFTTAICIFCFVRRRDGLRFPAVYLLVSGFMLWTGLTHLLAVAALWLPVFGLHGAAKAVTAAVSIAAGIVIWRVIPKAYRLPSTGELEALNRELAAEIARRGALETELRAVQARLEARVAERTREVEAARARAEAADRAKSEFLAQMSHDLRTPLNAVLGFSELLRSGMYGPLGDARYAEYATYIHRSGELLLELIDDLLDLARIEAGRTVLKIEPVALDNLVGDAVRAAELPATRKRIHIALPPAPFGMAVPADRKALRRMLDNLLGNAVRYTPEGGRIEVSGAAVDGGVRIVVADSGPGIPPEEVPRVVQPFMRGRDVASSTTGTGLGLAIVKSLVELHGGRVEIGRAALGGAEIAVWLPQESAAAHPPGRSAAA
ncbi:sensor histidine kinase [Desertibaculum subflavum]|uniref:sensor histidine kinase n=1 Tax=Desertibaculum subflavum TaxID=2268458 RepID=UPI000E673215